MSIYKHTFTPTPGTSIREAAEKAIKISRALGAAVFVEMNEARFSVNGDTKVQDAIDAYMEVKRKMYETAQKLKQNKR